MKALIEIIKEDPVDAIEGFISFGCIFAFAFLASAFLG